MKPLRKIIHFQLNFSQYWQLKITAVKHYLKYPFMMDGSELLFEIWKYIYPLLSRVKWERVEKLTLSSLKNFSERRERERDEKCVTLTQNNKTSCTRPVYWWFRRVQACGRLIILPLSQKTKTQTFTSRATLWRTNLNAISNKKSSLIIAPNELVQSDDICKPHILLATCQGHLFGVPNILRLRHFYICALGNVMCSCKSQGRTEVSSSVFLWETLSPEIERETRQVAWFCVL